MRFPWLLAALAGRFEHLATASLHHLRGTYFDCLLRPMLQILKWHRDMSETRIACVIRCRNSTSRLSFINNDRNISRERFLQMLCTFKFKNMDLL